MVLWLLFLLGGGNLALHIVELDLEAKLHALGLELECLLPIGVQKARMQVGDCGRSDLI